MDSRPVDFTGIAFFAGIVLVVLIVSLKRYWSERERQQTLRIALERGAALDPALLQQLLTPPQKPRSPHGLLVAGLVTVAFALGLLVLGLVLGLGPQADPEALKGLTGSAALFFFVGAALLIASKLVKRSSEPGM